MKKLQNSVALTIGIIILFVEYVVKVMLMIICIIFWPFMREYKDTNPFVMFVDRWGYHPISQHLYDWFKY